MSSALILPVIADESTFRELRQKNILNTSSTQNHKEAAKFYPYSTSIYLADFKNPLFDNFTEFIKQSFNKPWIATEIFLEHYLLHEDSVEIYLEETQESPDKTNELNVIMFFSDLADLFYVHACLASHWSRIWFERKKESIIEKHLYRQGLKLDPSRPVDSDQELFFPLNELGYIRHVPDPTSFEGEEAFHFELEGWVYQEFEFLECVYETHLKMFKELEPLVLALMSDGKCRCQFCMPDFDISLINKFRFDLDAIEQ
jgi:hypothetical protein